jgi:hypothetical protein
MVDGASTVICPERVTAVPAASAVALNQAIHCLGAPLTASEAPRHTFSIAPT